MTCRARCLVILLIASMGVAIRGAGPETFGVAPSLSEVTPLRQVIARPADLEGKTIRVDGVVTAVCSMMGCWLGLAPIDSPQGPTVLVKVDDGVIVFPTSARGRRATVQGVVQRVVEGNAEAQEAAREHAEHEARTQTAGEVRWQIKATGATIQ